MGGICWRDSSIDSGYTTDKTVRDGIHSVEAKCESADLGGDGCFRAPTDLRELGLDLKPVRGKGLGLVASRDFSKGVLSHQT